MDEKRNNKQHNSVNYVFQFELKMQGNSTKNCLNRPKQRKGEGKSP